MPEEIFGEKYHFLSRTQILSFEEITRLAGIMLQLGVSKLRLTGGEPLVRQRVDELVKQLAALPGADDLALTTNGVRLPLFAQKLKENGLQRVTVSLDSLDNEVFRRMNGQKANVSDVLEGIAAAEKAGLTPIKINCVVQRGVNDHTLVELARFCKERGYILRFIEFMDVGNQNGWRRDQVVSAQEIVERVDAAFPLRPLPRQYSSETALRYQYADGSGEMGVIASVTMPFCGDCTRLRLSPEGVIYTCLFATRGVDLKTPLRAGASDDDLKSLIAGTWLARTDRYSELRASFTDPDSGKHWQKIEMYYIGG
jgi:cyclic pyranopterin phosphate synthase